MSEQPHFIEPGDVETLVFDWGSIKWLSEPKVTGTGRFTAGVVILEPGRGHERHNHPGVEEILYVVSGEGEQMVETTTKDGQTHEARRKVGPGTLIHIPPDVFHETLNTGWEPLKLMAIYAPPGPEDVLRNLPGTRIFPAGETPRRS